MQFIDIHTPREKLQVAIEQAFSRILMHGRFLHGEEITKLEAMLANLLEIDHCSACSSGTDAIVMGLMALEVQPSDAIITTPFSFAATAEAIRLVGAVPIFSDIDPMTYNLDPVRLEETYDSYKDSANIRGIITVDIFGMPCLYKPIGEMASANGLFIVEDGAQAFGGAYQNKPLCSFGDIATTSFYPSKPLSCYGDGGAVFTNDASLQEKLVSIREHGKGTDTYDNQRLGLNARMDTIQAAILLEKLKLFPEELTRRQEIAASYSQMLSAEIQVQQTPENAHSAWALYSIRHQQRDGLQQHLKAAGIPSAIYYPKPLHRQKIYQSEFSNSENCQVADLIAKEIISIPMHPYLSDDEVAQVASAIASYG